MTPIIVNLLAFVAVFLAIFAVNAVIVDMREAERKRFRDRLAAQMRQEQRLRLEHDFSQIAAEARAVDEPKKTLYERWKFALEQSGLQWSVGRVASVSAAAGIVLGLVAFFATFAWPTTAVAVVVGFALPVLYVKYKRAKRIQRLRGQIPDAFELMARVLRSGQTIAQAIQAVSEEFDEPISLEFLFCFEQMNLGLEPDAAMRQLGRRTGLLELKIFVLAVLVHRQTGGNLAELLDKLAGVVRERFRIHGMIRSLTAQGRLQAAILLGLPPFMFVVLMMLHPEYEKTLLDYPMMVITALSMMFAGWLWIRRIVNFDY